MGIKLNPPQIETSLPPMFQYKVNNMYMCQITLPLYSNPSVSRGDFNKIKFRIKSVSTGKIIATQDSNNLNSSNVQFNDNFTTSFNGALFTIGQYYKLQLAYISIDGTEGYYSSVGIFKCTCKPTLLINNFDSNKTNEINGITTVFEGKYFCTDSSGTYSDSTEKVYSYCFTLFNGSNSSNNDNEIIETSGVLLHNIQKDESNTTSIDIWEPKTVLLDENKTYKIKYEITTINGLKASVEYNIRPSEINEDESRDLEVSNINENGYISIYSQSNFKAERYIIIRTSNKNEDQQWIKIKDCQKAGSWVANIYKDYFVEQGVTYEYKMYYQLNDKNKTQGIISEKSALVPMDFEDMFLSDGERQLCIRFNPKVSSFKSTILESKMDTLGGKYPFIFRNGNVNYKEFPISGLISMNMDPDSQFMTFSDISNPSNRERTAGNLAHGTESLTNLTGNNFYKERVFKTEVLNWLTNGKPKIFRSPAEGNFIVRLMNVSLTPNDTLGRMLHTFNCTAYEVAEYNMKNVEKYNLMPSDLEWS